MKNTQHDHAYWLTSVLALSLALALPACGEDKGKDDEATGNTAVAEIHGLGTNMAITGTLTFTQVAAGVMIAGSVSGLDPGSTHGMHLHENGDCSAADGMSAGGHWNPTAQVHGGLGSAASHLGDLGNVMADASGKAAVSLTKAGAKVGDGSALDVVGRGVIVHASADDLMTDPSGSSGARIACGSVHSASQR
jgi:Cu-Zn family superoxide dismutase